ncbi:hypothetical protein BDZ85DRAFT_265692, partial [Elsinoe ampelina]
MTRWRWRRSMMTRWGRVRAFMTWRRRWWWWGWATAAWRWWVRTTTRGTTMHWQVHPWSTPLAKGTCPIVGELIRLSGTATASATSAATTVSAFSRVDAGTNVVVDDIPEVCPFEGCLLIVIH